jgi:hypothetical protein
MSDEFDEHPTSEESLDNLIYVYQDKWKDVFIEIRKKSDGDNWREHLSEYEKTKLGKPYGSATIPDNEFATPEEAIANREEVESTLRHGDATMSDEHSSPKEVAENKKIIEESLRDTNVVRLNDAPPKAAPKTVSSREELFSYLNKMFAKINLNGNFRVLYKDPRTRKTL